MRVGQHLAGILAGAARHPGIAEQLHDLVLGVLACPRLDDPVELGAAYEVLAPWAEALLRRIASAGSIAADPAI